ncbi:hypothetical protein WHI96_11115 [Pseudonocardia tropica]|uniref:DUF7715 domain-containing protein n=1 Tax=Pseudonocardia tropica TaxID=681289 RepID=A0ABV1JTW6_9PSEU
MKVLVATALTQGERSGDYHWCVEGELVWLPPACSRDEADPDGGCGCGRGFGGLNSRRATTTARVADLELSHADYVEALRSSLEQQGWVSEWGDVTPEADDLLACAAELQVGVVLGRRLDQLVPRSQQAPR